MRSSRKRWCRLRVLAELPLLVDYASGTPDAHLGKCVTIGTVFASEEFVACWNVVGAYIWRGIAAVSTWGLCRRGPNASQKLEIFRRIKDRISTGFAKPGKILPEAKGGLEEIAEELWPTAYVKEQLLLPRAAGHLGTMGGGNHFPEIVRCDRDDTVWSLLHSGSHNIENSSVPAQPSNMAVWPRRYSSGRV